MAPALGYSVLMLTALLHATRDGTRWVPVSAGLVVTLVLLRWALHLRRGRTLVGHRGISARWALTERRWGWHDVYDIRAEPVPDAARHARKWLTYLYDNEGRRFLLPHLDDWQLTIHRARWPRYGRPAPMSVARPGSGGPRWRR